MSVEFADKSGDEFHRMAFRTTLADAQHQAGELAKSHRCFKEAKALQKKRQADTPQLYSLQGFRYCDLLLTGGEWREVQQRAEQTLEWITNANIDILSASLDQLSLGRASLQQAFDEHGEGITSESASKLPLEFQIPIKLSKSSALLQAKDWLDQAVEGLRKAGSEQYLPHGLLARACYYRFCGYIETDEKQTRALADLEEAYDITERGGMRLFLTDYHLKSARLSFGLTQKSVHELTTIEHLQKAKKLIKDTGYHRRNAEVAYLELAIIKTKSNQRQHHDR